MDYERLSLNPDQQLQIDDAFLDSAITTLQAKDHYHVMARLTAITGLGAALEEVYVRTLDRANENLIRGEELGVPLLRLLGKISFVDALLLPSADKVQSKKTPPEHRALWDWYDFRRLFIGLPNSDR